LAATLAGNLGCKYIFHINLPEYSATNCDENIKVAIYDCLNRCNHFRLDSLAFPALGTGSLRYPADVTAKSMFKHVKSWLGENSNVGMKLISFVVFPNDTKSVEGFSVMNAMTYTDL